MSQWTIESTSQVLKWMGKATEREVIRAELWSSSPFMIEFIVTHFPLKNNVPAKLHE